MTDVEKRMVRALLFAAGVDKSQHDWIVEACPSVEWARETYGRSYEKPLKLRLDPADVETLRLAREACIAARRSGDEMALAEARNALQTEIAIIQDKLGLVFEGSRVSRQDWNRSDTRRKV
jgi:hypothetical protein